MARVKEPPPAVELTPEQRDVIEQVQVCARALAGALNSAERAEIPQAVLLPELVQIMRETGLLPESFSLRSLVPFLRSSS